MLSTISSMIGEVPDDNGINLIEDITDTFNDYETRLSSMGDWESERVRLNNRITELDNDWRQRYTERFMGNSNEVPDKPEESQFHDDVDNGMNITIDDLFTIK